mgnify:CR=1 FL=1
MVTLLDAIKWALEQLDGEQSPYEHGFVDLVRKYLDEHNVDYPPIDLADVEPYLPQ